MVLYKSKYKKRLQTAIQITTKIAYLVNGDL